KIDRAGRADEVARVNLRLGGVASRLERQSDQLVSVYDHPHCLGFRVKLDEVGIATIGRGADVDLAVFTLTQGEVPGLLGRRLGRDVVGGRPKVFDRSARWLS